MRHRSAAAIWNDANQNGRRDEGESGQSGAVVFADLNDNASRDVGEPFTTSLADDVATTDVDESGQYVISGLAAATTYSILIDSEIHNQTNPIVFSQNNGLLTYKDEFIAKSSSSANGFGLLQAETVIASDDGRHILHHFTGRTHGRCGSGVILAPTHFLSFNRSILNRASLRIGPSHANLRNHSGWPIRIHWQFRHDLHRHPRPGDRPVDVWIETEPRRCGAVGVFTGSTSFVASPDSRWLYASGPSASFSVFQIDQNDGSLTLVQQFVNGENGVSGMGSVRNVAVTPDGSQVFVTTTPDNELQIYDVTPGTGRLGLGSEIHLRLQQRGHSVLARRKFRLCRRTEFWPTSVFTSVTH